MLNKIWSYGTYSPIQRTGLIILALGCASFLFWIVEDRTFYYSRLYGLVFDYAFPRLRYDGLFAWIHLYLLPLGLLMTWLYHPINKIIKIILRWINRNS